MKIILATVAAAMLSVAALAPSAQAACYPTPHGWNCWHPHWHPHWHHWHHDW